MPVTVVVNRQALIGMGRAPGGDLTRFWLKLLADIDRRAKTKLSGGYVRVQTGNLRSSQQTPFITYRGDQIVGVVQNVAAYAMPLHEGSRAHDIRPVHRKFLSGWTYQGAPVFTKLVHKPATRPRPWLRDSLREAVQAAGLT